MKKKNNENKKKKGNQKKTKRNVVLERYRETGTAYSADSKEGRALMSAFANPFDPRNEGIRICDAYAFPTACFHLKGTIALKQAEKTVAGVTTRYGSCAVFVSACPITSMVDLANNFGYNDTTTTCIASTPMGRYSANQRIYTATTPTALSSVIRNYRVVCAGFKVRCTMPEIARTGRIFVAPVMHTAGVPGYQMLEVETMGDAAEAGIRLLGGISAGLAGSASILNLPGAFETSVVDLGLKDLILLPKPTSAYYQTFRSSVDSSNFYSTTGDFGDQVLATNPGSTFSVAQSSSTDPAGMSGFLIRVEGLPTDVSLPIIDIEYIYHLEGTPNLGFTVGVPVPSSAMKSSISTNGFHKALDYASRLPWGSMVDAGLNGMGISGVGAALLKGIKNF